MLAPKGWGKSFCKVGNPYLMHQKPSLQQKNDMPSSKRKTLPIVHRTQTFHQFICGRPTQVESDNKPLQCILSNPLHQAPLRLQKTMPALQRYDLKVKYLPGSELSVANALTKRQQTTETLFPDLVVNEVQLTAQSFPFQQRNTLSSRKPLQMIQPCKP